MNKVEMITSIINLHDENEKLKNDVEKYKDKLEVNNTVDRVETNEVLKDKIYEIGKELLFDKVVYSWSQVSGSLDDNGEVYRVTEYKKWLKNKINLDNMPKTLSYDDFIKVFEKELKEKYEEEKKEKIEDLKNEQ